MSLYLLWQDSLEELSIEGTFCLESKQLYQPTVTFIAVFTRLRLVLVHADVTFLVSLEKITLLFGKEEAEKELEI